MNSRVLFHLLQHHSRQQGRLASGRLFCICSPNIPTLRAQTSSSGDDHTLNTAVFIRGIMEICIVSGCLSLFGSPHLHDFIPFQWRGGKAFLSPSPPLKLICKYSTIPCLTATQRKCITVVVFVSNKLLYFVFLCFLTQLTLGKPSQNDALTSFLLFLAILRFLLIDSSPLNLCC